MKTTHALALILSLAAVTAHAQTVNGTATSANTVQSTSAAQNAGNSQALGLTSITNADGTIRNTPGSVMGGFSGSFSADYCKGTAQATGSGPGISLGFGGPVSDSDCVKYRGVERTMQIASTIRGFAPQDAHKLDQAAIDMLCSVPDIAPALRNQSLCTLPEEQRRATVSQNSIYSGGQ